MKILKLSDLTPLSMEVNAEPYHDFLPPIERKSKSREGFREAFTDEIIDFVMYINYNHRI